MTRNIKKCLLITLISLFFSSHVNIKAHSRITLAEKIVYNPFKTYYFNYESCLWIICYGHIMTDDSKSFAQMTVVAWQTCRGIETSGFLKHSVIQFQLQVDHQQTINRLPDVDYTQKCKIDLIGAWVFNTICVINKFVAFKLLKGGFIQHNF